jgi:sulfur dioxygenase
MIFRQLFDRESSTYTYLLAEGAGGEALLIDPVIERVDQYLGLIEQLDLRLVLAVDTHIHADHVTGLGELRERTDCVTVMGERSQAECVSWHVKEGEWLRVDGLALEAIYTPGHTDDSMSFLLPKTHGPGRVFTGDTLLIRGTGRTDFQNGDPAAQYDSLFGKLLKLPDETLVYPAHDYNGMTLSTVGEERRFNPRLQVKDKAEYVALMSALKLDNPRLMDIAVPANRACGARPGGREGARQDDIFQRLLRSMASP